MRVENVRPIGGRVTSTGAIIEAEFDLEFEPGVTCRALTLVRSATDGGALVWSYRGPRGPAVRVGPRARQAIVALVRDELAAMTQALRAA